MKKNLINIKIRPFIFVVFFLTVIVLFSSNRTFSNGWFTSKVTSIPSGSFTIYRANPVVANPTSMIEVSPDSAAAEAQEPPIYEESTIGDEATVDEEKDEQSLLDAPITSEGINTDGFIDSSEPMTQKDRTEVNHEINEPN